MSKLYLVLTAALALPGFWLSGEGRHQPMGVTFVLPRRWKAAAVALVNARAIVADGEIVDIPGIGCRGSSMPRVCGSSGPTPAAKSKKSAAPWPCKVSQGNRCCGVTMSR